ncbi:iron-chelator utilization protein [Striga asiatica]|uniref:Iron-chelator utilization protein n=1 Tax=Striga asiatica TaxID=4170 RepID=A0A5A7NYK5_STRAF|nr:iron-chelator utilization protein [Striga asiatica]
MQDMTQKLLATPAQVNLVALVPQREIADDAFWNDPVTLAAIDDIMKAVEQREHFREHDEDADDNYNHASGEATAFVIPAVTPGVVIDQQMVETPPVVDAQLGSVDDVRGSPRLNRRIQATSAMKSPYQERAIDVVKKLDGKEKMIVNWIMKNDAADGSSKLVGLAIPDVVDMAWVKGVDEADVGVITMRHMETFKGAVGESWNPQLKVGDKGQTKLMRKRYSYVIACAPNNKLRDINLAEANRFHPVYLAKKQHIETPRPDG